MAKDRLSVRSYLRCSNQKIQEAKNSASSRELVRLSRLTKYISWCAQESVASEAVFEIVDSSYNLEFKTHQIRKLTSFLRRNVM